METQENRLSNCCDMPATDTGFCTQCWEACATYEVEPDDFDDLMNRPEWQQHLDNLLWISFSTQYVL